MRAITAWMVLLLCLPAWSLEGPVPIPELSRPAILLVSEGRMFILERTTIYIYSLPDLKLQKTFGRKGEGPSEFITQPYGPPMSMSLKDGQLAVNSMNKLSFFTLEGKFIRMVRTNPNMVFYPFQDRYIAVGPVTGERTLPLVSFQLMDSGFKLDKILLKTDVDVSFQYIDIPMNAFTHRPFYGGRIFLPDESNEFLIKVYDEEGEEIYRIEKDEPRLPVTTEFRDTVHRWFKAEPRFRELYSEFRDRIHFKKFFPAIRDLHITADTLCAVTHRHRGSRYECIFMDHHGNEKSRYYLPLNPYTPHTYYPILYTIHSGVFYSLIEDPEAEVWELHRMKLKLRP